MYKSPPETRPPLQCGHFKSVVPGLSEQAIFGQYIIIVKDNIVLHGLGQDTVVLNAGGKVLSNLIWVWSLLYAGGKEVGVPLRTTSAAEEARGQR